MANFFADLFGASDAANDIKRQQKNNINESNAAYSDISGLYAPYVQSGQQATGKINDLLGLNGTGAQTTAYNNYQASPDFQVRFDNGLKALDRSSIAKYGPGANGNVLKAITQYGQDQGQLGYNDYYNKLFGQQGVGFQGTQGTANARTNNASQVINANTNIGNAQANADLAGGNILGGILSLGTQLFAPGIRSAANSISNAFNPVATTGRPISVGGGDGSQYYW